MNWDLAIVALLLTLAFICIVRLMSWVFHLQDQIRALEHARANHWDYLGELRNRLDSLPKPPCTRVEFQNLQDAVDNLELGEQARTNLNIMHAAQMSHLQTELRKLRLHPLYSFREPQEN